MPCPNVQEGQAVCAGGSHLALELGEFWLERQRLIAIQRRLFVFAQLLVHQRSVEVRLGEFRRQPDGFVQRLLRRFELLIEQTFDALGRDRIPRFG